MSTPHRCVEEDDVGKVTVMLTATLYADVQIGDGQ